MTMTKKNHIDIRQVLKLACGTDDPLVLKLRGGGVRRYHNERLAGIDQTVEAHSWRVAVILLHLWPESRGVVVQAALMHDVAEGVLGDAPAPAKMLPVLANAYDEAERQLEEVISLCNLSMLTDVERARLKCCDYIELCLTCYSRPQNGATRRIFNTGRDLVSQHVDGLPIEDETKIAHIFQQIEMGVFDV